MVTLYKDGAALTVIPELVDCYKAMGWAEEEPEKKAPTAKKRTAKAESET